MKTLAWGAAGLAFALVCATFGAAAPPPAEEPALPFSFERRAGHPATPAVVAHLKASLQADPAKHQATLEAMQKQGAGAVEVLADELSRTPPEARMERWLLVYTIGNVESPASLDLLTRIAQAPIPAELKPAVHGFGPLEHERIVKLAAVEGIVRLAKKGNQPARNLLRHLASSTPHATLLAAAAAGFVETASDPAAARSELARLVPKDRAALLQVRTLDATRQPPLQYRRGLRGGAR